MELRNKLTGEILTEQQFRTLHKNTSLARKLTKEAINFLGFDLVNIETQPVLTPSQTAIRNGEKQVNSEWVADWSITEKPLADVKQHQIQLLNLEVKIKIRSLADTETQINQLTRYQQLQDIVNGADVLARTLTTEEATERDAIKAIRSQVAQLRSEYSAAKIDIESKFNNAEVLGVTPEFVWGI